MSAGGQYGKADAAVISIQQKFKPEAGSIAAI